MLVTIVIFIIILSVLVLVHEFGHFIVAILLGIKVEEFGFGFPPRAVGKKIGETIFSLNWLPIGGFVKVYGEDAAGGGRVGTSKKEQIKDVKRAFFSRPIWQRGLVVVAGVVMNYLLAGALYTFLNAYQGVPKDANRVIIQSVEPNSPAQKAGLAGNDIIVSINGQIIKNTDQLSSITKKNLGKPVTVVVKNASGQTLSTSLIPRVHHAANQGAMGVSIAQDVTYNKMPLGKALTSGFNMANQGVWLIIVGFGILVSQIPGLLLHATVPAGVGGPICIAQVTGEVAKAGGFFGLVSLTAIISLNLAVLNILPIPALDGGRFFFILYEAVTRRKVNAQLEERVHVIGMTILLAIVFLISIHDLLTVLAGKSCIPQ